MQKPRVLIIGGGAAGLTAAIAAARRGSAVTILEAGARVGRKILASGNGRCNLSNLAVSPAAYNHPEFVEPVVSAIACEGVRDFFESMGMPSHADEEGRVYPTTNAANSVLDVLRLECSHLGVVERCDFEVGHVSSTSGSPRFTVSSVSGAKVGGDAVVVTTGGGDPLLAEMGHELVECTPVLGPISTDYAPIRGLSGVRVKCAARVVSSEGETLALERGELLFRDYGVSGILAFDLSRFLADGCVLSIDFLPDLEPAACGEMIAKRCVDLSWRTAETYFDGLLHKRVALAVLREAGIDAQTPASELPAERLAALLKDYRLAVVGRVDAKQAQVTRGGAAVEGFDPRTMASLHVEGVFAAGEVLDVDGRCGGFNLHWAWASGIVAGESAARAAAGVA